MLDVGILLTDALVVAHARGVVHRDLKPANQLVAADGRIQNADSGICFLADDEAERITGDAAPTIGTRQFVAPELRGGGPVETVGPRADIYLLEQRAVASEVALEVRADDLELAWFVVVGQERERVVCEARSAPRTVLERNW